MLNSTILQNKPIASGIYEMALRFDAGVAGFQPGQFAHVKLPDEKMLLRRPISLNHIDEEAGSATLVYQVKGDGTKLMSSLKQGERLDVLAPLGRGFWKPDGLKKAALVGGGIGAAPLRMLPEAWPDVEFDAFLGFRSDAFAYQLDKFRALSRNLRLCSDDGTLGDKTFVTCLLGDNLTGGGYDAIFACGPAPMLKALKAVLADGKTHCQVSLEERMGCGVGACLVCNCKILSDGEWHYRRVCKDGPVFDIAEVDFDGQA
jgi:dihydroorotate dehydrogenase electron transfer subunit